EPAAVRCEPVLRPRYVDLSRAAMGVASGLLVAAHCGAHLGPRTLRVESRWVHFCRWLLGLPARRSGPALCAGLLHRCALQAARLVLHAERGDQHRTTVRLPVRQAPIVLLRRLLWGALREPRLCAVVRRLSL